MEAYAVCPEFNKLGYNCFLLQRRVAPYNNDDIVMDMQRAVRMVKYYSDQWGIDLEGSLLAVSGYSGSGGNIRTMLKKSFTATSPPASLTLTTSATPWTPSTAMWTWPI